ncbi:hypothetical protein [Endozoicomonas sp. SCSIO W0465]|uniref:hypothetical protein n=1 Tax=Endozoicomonas sp. SCSIO W0465 TaxID=2918516 RepID=UPI002076059E|nr:hypothetical protein [Endozoicomonas sp. SCSIO W0465]USE33937.1 hypothetical protein MJO57_17355 [Endozoicomonas sp. SCSIO W0465]
MINLHVVPPHVRNLLIKDSVDGINCLPKTTEAQQNIPKSSNLMCHETAHRLSSRDITGHDDSASAGNAVKSRKRPFSADSDVEVVPQKSAKNEPITVSNNAAAYMVCFRYKMSKIIEKANFQLLLATQQKMNELENKKKEMATLVEKIEKCESSLSDPMHPMIYAFKLMSQDLSLKQWAKLQREVQKLTLLLGQIEWKKQFIMESVSKQATQLILTCKELPGVEQLVEEYMKNLNLTPPPAS